MMKRLFIYIDQARINYQHRIYLSFKNITLMASKYLQQFPVPSGFTELLADFVREILRDQPKNIVEYGAHYFEALQKGKKIQFNSQTNIKKQDKKYELAYNPKEASDITKKSSNIAMKMETQEEKLQSKLEIEDYMKEVQGQVLNKNIDDMVDKQFSTLDVKHQGHISIEQIQKYLRELIKNLGYSVETSEEDIQAYLRQIQTNRDGKVSKEEFIKLVRRFI